MHGDPSLYELLFEYIEARRPDALFLAGDLLPPLGVQRRFLGFDGVDFVNRFLVRRLAALRERLGPSYPAIYLILGNDDVRFEEGSVFIAGTERVWTYAHGRRLRLEGRAVYGYCCIPPSPFLLKDWERYDVSRYVDPGCVSPEDGMLSVPRSTRDRRHATIAAELDDLIGEDEVSRAIFLFHVPPYRSALDTADLAGRSVEGVPLDPHVGSIAVRRMIEQRRPYLTLHGHVHEAYRLTGSFKEQIGATWCFSAAHDGEGLAIVEFKLSSPQDARREVLR